MHYRVYPYTPVTPYVWWLGFLLGLQLAILLRLARRADRDTAAAVDVDVRTFVAPVAGPAETVEP